MYKKILPFIIFPIFSLTGCDKLEMPVSNSPLCNYKKIDIDFNHNTLSSSVACSNEDREKGLMNIQSLPKDEGMIFIFADEQPLYFWMKNTYIPLSIAFVDSSWKIVDIKEMKALDETSIPSSSPAMYAIEANSNWFSEHGIKVGDRVVLNKGIK